MVFLPKGAKTYKLRIDAPDGRHATLSTECKSIEDARAIEVAYKLWRGDRGQQFARTDLLTALVEKRIKLRDAWEASVQGTLHLLLADAPVAPPPAPRGLTKLALEWHTWKAEQKKGAKSADSYLRQLKTLYPEIEKAAFHLGHFTRVELAKRLDGLTVDAPTKNRYKLAASGFAKFLVRRGILETNFVRDIEGFGENDPRMVYYERPEAKRLIGGMPQPYAGAVAFMAAFCMEWGAVQGLLVTDVDLTKGKERVYVRGTKTKHRLRSVPLVEENRWLLPYLAKATEGKLGGLVFPGLQKWTLAREQRKAAKALKVQAVGEERFGKHTLHDWRHTHTVQLLRDGYSEQIAADHLGHADTNLVRTRYGRWITTEADYRRKRIVVESDSTDSSTTSQSTSKRAAN